MEVIQAAAEGFPGNTPMGEIFDLLRKQPQLTAVQRAGLDLWDSGECDGKIIVPVWELEEQHAG